MKALFEFFVRIVSSLRFIPELLSRFTIGFVFAESGWGKLHHLPKTVEFFTSLGIPYSHIQAPLVGGLEFFCGVLIFLGLATRLASIPLIAILIVAIKTAKADELTGLSAILGISEYLYIIVLFWLLTEGAGRLSVDSLLRKK